MNDLGFVIRKSDIDGLLAKVAERKHKQYLLRMTLAKIRGIEDQVIYFDFPVTAVIGVNGGGKTTVLGSAGLAYIKVEPKTFFAKGGKHDPSMKDWKVQFEYLDRPNTPNATTATASYKTSKWDRKKLEREVLIFGVNRTVPANERKDLRKFASGQFRVAADKVKEFQLNVIKFAGRILGKDLSGFRQLETNEDGDIKFMSGKTSKGTEFSEFHFGAGESSVIRIVASIEATEDYSLFLIEEIENGLHPVATRKLVEYLIDAAKRKNVQVIFTTHSDAALEILPHKAIWSISDGKARQGKLNVDSLRALTGSVEKESAIFVEDDFAKVMVEAIFRQLDPSLLDRCEIHAMKGDSIALKTTNEHRKNPAIKTAAFCILDGDSAQAENSDEGIYKLSGNAPEIEIFGRVMENWDTLGGNLTIALNQSVDSQDEVKRKLQQVLLDVGGHHLYFVRAADVLSFLPRVTVEQAFCNLYA